MGSREDDLSLFAGDNEPWTLVNTTDNYNAIVSAIRFRDQLRNYVMDTQASYTRVSDEAPQRYQQIPLPSQATWSTTNAPMISPIWLLFPGDPICAFNANGNEPACGEGAS